MSDNGTVDLTPKTEFSNYLAIQFSPDGKQMQIQINPVGIPITKENLLLALHTLHCAVEDYIKEQQARLKSQVISTLPLSVIDRLRT